MGAKGKVKRLSELEPGEIADCFVQVVEKLAQTTRGGDPYFRLVLKDRWRRVPAMVWKNSPVFRFVSDEVQNAQMLKVRCQYNDTSQYGPQVELVKVRHTTAKDEAEGLDLGDFYERTRFDVDEMFTELVGLAERHIEDEKLNQLTVAVLSQHEKAFKESPAASHHHHAFAGGLLEHTLSVTRTCIHLAEKYARHYDQLGVPLNKDLIVAGGILHDVGKVAELGTQEGNPHYTVPGRLLGHMLLGRDIVRETAGRIEDFPERLLLLLEHIVVAHQGQLEWSAPVLPAIAECLIVHYADDLDAKVNMAVHTVETDTGDDPFTSRRNPLQRSLLRREWMQEAEER